MFIDNEEDRKRVAAVRRVREAMSWLEDRAPTSLLEAQGAELEQKCVEVEQLNRRRAA